MVKCRKYSDVKFEDFVYFCITREKALPHFYIVEWGMVHLIVNISESEASKAHDNKRPKRCQGHEQFCLH